MNGKELHQRVKVSGLGWKVVAEAMQLSKQGLYDLYKKDDIGDFYLSKAKELKLTEVGIGQNEVKPESSGDLVAVIGLIDRMREDSAQDKRDLMEIFRSFFEENKKTLEDYRSLLKKNNIIA